MLKLNFLIIFLLFLLVLIDAIDEDFFDDLWKNLKPSTSKNFKEQKIREINAIKEEIVDKNEKYEQQNSYKVMIKSENCNEKEMEDIKPKELQKVKKEQLKEENNNTKIKVPKIVLDQMSEESFENEFDEQDNQNVSCADQSNSADDDEYYNNMNTEEINEMETLNKFNLMKKELRKENVYKTLTNTQFECEIAKKLGTNRSKIFKLKKKLGQIRKRIEESEETKMELITKFDQLRKEKIYGFKYDKKKICKIECEIAKELGINRKKIYKWKKEFGLLKGFSFSNEQKIEKIQSFEKVKEKFCKKFNLKTNSIINEKIAEKIGVLLNTIYAWKNKLNLKTRKTKSYTNVDKLEYVKRGEEIKKKKPNVA